uniref:C3H1-type domain-containing protein n=1 Tax=Steinernema glaseri TaxID=37863 RepID=A0A1I8AJZ3_9BILA
MGHTQHQNKLRRIEINIVFADRKKSTSLSSGRSDVTDSSQNSGNGKQEPVWKRLKTKMCRNLEKSGKCPFGKTCWYAHTEAELRSPDDVNSGKAIEQLLKDLAQEKERRKEYQARKFAGPRNHRSRNNQQKIHQAPVPVPQMVFSVPPPNMYVPLLNGPNGTPQWEQYEKARLLSVMLSQETEVIKFRECVRYKEQKMQDATSDKEKARIERELGLLKNYLNVAEATLEKMREDFVAWTPQDCSQEQRKENMHGYSGDDAPYY